MQIGVNFAVGKQPAEFVVINQPRTVLVHFPHELVNINRQLRAACKRLQFVYTDLPLGSRAASKDFKSSSHIRRIAILLRLLEEPFPAHHCKLSEVDAHIRVFHFARRSDHLYYHLVSYLMTACEEERLAQLPKVHVSQQWVSEDVFAPAIDRRIKIAEAMELNHMQTCQKRAHIRPCSLSLCAEGSGRITHTPYQFASTAAQTHT
mmetsp:Transcript_72127/g.116993  ORF Transcript_72127/g.116993 Transcript_72127/m.116993 type:complete len:206 (-) Transcript_72127:297-914(-)